MNDWNKWRALSREDRRLLLQAAALLVFAKLALPLIEFRVDRRASETLQPAELTKAAAANARTTARFVAIAAARGPVTVTCLPRSLALWWLLRRHSIRCELRLGAATAQGRLDAHAWVECDGVALNEAPAHLARYRPFAEAVVPVVRRLPWWPIVRRTS